LPLFPPFFNDFEMIETSIFRARVWQKQQCMSTLQRTMVRRKHDSGSIKVEFEPTGSELGVNREKRLARSRPTRFQKI
jgi:hypothetical protein